MRGRLQCLVSVVALASFLVGGGVLATAVAAEKATVDFPSWWYGEPGMVEFLQVLEEAFEKEYTNIKINGYDVPFDAYQDRVLVEVSAGTPPQILHLLDTSMRQYYEIGGLAPLDKWMDQTDIKQRFSQIQREAPVVIDGQTYGLYQGVFNYIPFYNKRLFNEKGIGAFPTTMDEFLKTAKKLTDPPQQYGYAIASRPGDRDHMMQNFGGYAVGYGGKIDEANSPEMIRAVTMFKKAFDSGAIPPDTAHSVFYPMWWNEKVACLFEGSYMYAMARTENPEILPDLATALPPFPTHKSTTICQILSLAEEADSLDAAWKFLEFWARPEWQAKQVEMTMVLTAEIGGGVTTQMLEEYPWMYSFAVSADISEFPYNPEILPYLPQINKTVIDHLEKVLFADAPVKETMEACQDEIDAVTGG